MTSEVLKFTIVGDDQNASETFKKFGESVKHSISFVKDAAIAVAAAGAAVLAFTSKVADHIGQQADFAKRLGVSIESLSTYQHVAGMAGMQSQTFNQSIQYMTRVVAEAANGNKELSKHIQGLGIDAQAFKGMGLDKQLELLADKFKGVTSEADKLRIATRLFGEQGAGMLVMLKDGSEAMRKAAEDARYLGVAISSQAAAQAELFGDQLDRSKASMLGLSYAIAGELMPLLGGLADKFTDVVAQSRSSIASMVKDTIEGMFVIGHVINQVGDTMYKVFTDPTAMVEFLKNILAIIPKSFEAWVAVAKTIPTAFGRGFDAVIKSADLLIQSIARSWLRIGEVITKAISIGIEGAKDVILNFSSWTRESLAQVLSGGGTDGLGDKLAMSISSSLEKAKANIAATLSTLPDVYKTNAIDFAGAIQDSFAGAGAAVGDTLKDVHSAWNSGNAKVASAWGTALGVDIEAAKVAAQESLSSISTYASESTAAVVEGSGEAVKTSVAAIAQHNEQIQAMSAETAQAMGEATMTATMAQFTMMDEMRAAQEESHAAFIAWLSFMNQDFIDALYGSVIDGTTALSQGLANAIVTGSSVMQVFKNVAQQAITSVLAALIQLGIQRLILSKLVGGVVTKEASAEAAKAVGLAGANMFASWAAAPWPISMAAPVMAAKATMGAAAAFSTGAGIGAAAGASIGAVMHGGMTNNPSEVTATIHKGERVISPRQNQDLTDALADGSLGGGAQVGSINIVMFPNATNAEAVFKMDTAEMASFMEEAIITALNNMDRQGIRPAFVERMQ